MRASGSAKLEILPARKDFLAAARARKVVAPGLVLQMRRRDDDTAAPARVGYTASRKVGNAVKRNRARRRLRAAVNDVLAGRALGGHDYVLIARAATAGRPYDALLADLASALDRIEKKS
ncbi:MAG: ribonuclease P protein component [Thalassobaculaceae bacterium]|nr:ribonuclease P protein component [Thalassobaculaceae bacterium]